MQARTQRRLRGAGRPRPRTAARAAGRGDPAHPPARAAPAGDEPQAQAQPGREEPGPSAGPAREVVGVLGGQDFIYSQANGVEELLFKGEGVLGVNADVASMDFRERAGVKAARDLDAALHCPPRFRDRVAVHLTRNFWARAGGPFARVPLILAIWGHKGCGKSFNVELACKQMGVAVVALSAGELEDQLAGEVAKRVRQRYETCVRLVEKEGRAAVLVISDVDAGLGMNGAQMTVNTQNCVGELMNLCDGASGTHRSRIPIVVTANDLSTVYAPLLRDGRMEKFYWNPTGDEKARMLHATLRDAAAAADGSSPSLADCAALVAQYPAQPLDFFAAARARCVDEAVRSYIATVPLSRLGAEIMRAYDWTTKKARVLEGGALGASASMDALAAHADDLVREQEHVKASNLAFDYFKNMETDAEWAAQQRREDREARAREMRKAALAAATRRAADAAEALAAEARAAMAESFAEARQEMEQMEAEAAREEEERAREQAAGIAWAQADVEAAAALVEAEGYALVDVRDKKVHSRESLKFGASSLSVPAVVVSGFGESRVEEEAETFAGGLEKAAANHAGLVLFGASSSDTEAAAARAHAEGGVGEGAFVELVGGMEAWLKVFTPSGKRRPRQVYMEKGKTDSINDLFVSSN